MSRALFALPAACMLVVPVKANAQAQKPQRQSPGEPTSSASASIDPALVGHWELADVERLGSIEDFGAVVDEMECDFGADGEAHVTLAIEQDSDTMERARTFRFVTADSRIVADQGPAVGYEVIGENDIRLMTSDGLVVHLRRADGGA